MILIPEMQFTILLCPVCVCIFLSEFTFVFGIFPFFRNLTVFDFLFSSRLFLCRGAFTNVASTIVPLWLGTFFGSHSVGFLIISDFPRTCPTRDNPLGVINLSSLATISIFRISLHFSGAVFSALFSILL